METQTKQPKRRRRLWRRVVSVVSFSALIGVLILFCLVWQQRVAVATYVIRKALDRQGLHEISFHLKQLDAGHVAVENIRLASPEPVFEIGRVEARFLIADVVRGYVENVRVSGVRTRAFSDGRKIISPVYEEYIKWQKGQAVRMGTRPAKVGQAKALLRSISISDVQVEVVPAGGSPVATMTVCAGALAESDGQYRVWGSAGDGRNVCAGFDGTAQIESGTFVLNPEIEIMNMGGVVELARLFASDRVTVLPSQLTNCSLKARGSVTVSGWTNVGVFDASAELGRNSTIVMPGQDRYVRFQTLRVEASGTPNDVKARVSAGISGLRLGGDRHVAQEEGRLLSLRSAMRYRKTATNQWVSATFDSDMPGRSVSQVLPNLLPLIPKFFTEGGTLHAEADISRSPHREWDGVVSFKAEARRSTLSSASGRAGAGRVAVSANVAVVAGHTGEAKTEVVVEDGYFFKRGMSVRAGGMMALTAHPPYASASGILSGQINETIALQKAGIVLPGGAVRFEGTAKLTGLVTNPVWQLGLRVPEFGVTVQKGAAVMQTTGGAAAVVGYSASRLALDGELWARDTAVVVSPSGTVGVAQAGIGHIGAQVHVPSYDPSTFSNAIVQCWLNVSNGWMRAEGVLALDDVCASVPLAWSGVSGLTFKTGQSLTWKHWEAAGMHLVPSAFGLESRDGVVDAQMGLRFTDSALGINLRACVPLDAPQRTGIEVDVPETEIATGDALVSLLCKKVPGLEVGARVGAKAQLRFLGVQPHVLGRVRVAEGSAKKGDLSVSGLTLDMPFEWGGFFRTIERPSITFTQLKMGNVRLDKGDVAFQLTPEEVFVDRVSVGWCKGSLNAYSLHLNVKKPKDNFVVYADRIDLGEALMMVMPFKGMVEGVLYGQFPVGFDSGHVKLSTGFLYSLPGQGGKLRLDDQTPMVSLLNRAGIQGNVQKPLARALSDMDFSLIRLELEPEAKGDAVLRMKLDGKSNFREWPAPVALNLNLHGPLEEILNLGLDMSRK